MSDSEKLALVVSEGSYDKAMASVFLGTTAAGMGMEVHVFFTFFGLKLLKKNARPKLPGLYRIATGMFEKKMKGVGVDSFGEMLETAQELGVKLYACSTSMEAMGMSRDQLVDGVDILGAAAFLNIAADCKVQLFIG
ncbi:MAG: DsrE/DsrF/DrsH-like family protein [Candidatus Methanomethylophilaceae archaeon]|nr:DsrE/DsrF/DrsH-like family protein [Candidatus Methanomethylophilaceae archaeon]